MTVDVASRRRLKDVNESFQHRADEIVVDDSLFPAPGTGQVQLATYAGTHAATS